MQTVQDHLASMRKNEIVKVAKTIGVDTQNVSRKEELINGIVEEMNRRIDAIAKARSGRGQKSSDSMISSTNERNHTSNDRGPSRRGAQGVDQKRVEQILNSDMTKSDKMRELYDLGIHEINEIKDLVGAHYSFAHNVVRRHEEVGQNS